MKNTRDLAVCGLVAALVAVGAFIKISIPVQPFPMTFTLQWFFVLLAGLLLGEKRAGTSVGIYLVTGLIGVPVFAHGGGLAYLARPTFGFLLGFGFAANIMGLICDRMRPISMRAMLVPASVGLMIYYLTGMVYFYFISNYVLSMQVGWKLVLVNCCLITIGQDFILCVLAAATAVKLKPALQFLQQ